MDTIQHAAIKRTDGITKTGESHADIIRTSPEGTCKDGSTQGFLTSTGKFVDRMKAMKIAIDSGQVDPELRTLRKTGLLSENLWADSHFGYDTIEGYFSLKDINLTAKNRKLVFVLARMQNCYYHHQEGSDLMKSHQSHLFSMIFNDMPAVINGDDSSIRTTGQMFQPEKDINEEAEIRKMMETDSKFSSSGKFSRFVDEVKTMQELQRRYPTCETCGGERVVKAKEGSQKRYVACPDCEIPKRTQNLWCKFNERGFCDRCGRPASFEVRRLYEGDVPCGHRYEHAFDARIRAAEAKTKMYEDLTEKYKRDSEKYLKMLHDKKICPDCGAVDKVCDCPFG